MVATKRLLAIAQRGFRNDLVNAMKALAADLSVVLLQGAAGQGNQPIPRHVVPTVRTQVEQKIIRFFVGADGRSPFGTDGVTPLAKYPELLNKWYAWVVAQQVLAQHNWMKRNLPDDVFQFLARRSQRKLPVVQRETENPFTRLPGESLDDYRARLKNLRIFSGPPPAYDPMHTWVDPNGYTLSDRIWNTADTTRTQIDLLVADAIREGKSVIEISKQLERFLNPDGAALRTNKPYGSDASYSATRLARTELSRANNQAAYMSAQMNPYVSGMDWALSGSHPKVDICEEYATLDGGGNRIRDPYPMDAAEVPPSHPNCVTPGQRVQTERGSIPIEQVRKGDKVLTHEGRYCLVKDAWNTPFDGLVYRITTRAGQFEVTGNHPILSGGRWVDALQFHIGDVVRWNGAERTVINVSRRWYQGLVYNMTVAEDNSYTVNGAVVHNCLCRTQPYVDSSAASEITAQLRAAMQDAQADLLEAFPTPADYEGFLLQLLGAYLGSMILQMLKEN